DIIGFSQHFLDKKLHLRGSFATGWQPLQGAALSMQPSSILKHLQVTPENYILVINPA
ncbi:hypothetical protein XENOCAPTIV_003867, partial [Xenoophorus captivus]